MMFINYRDADEAPSSEAKAMMLIADLQAAAQRLLDHSPGADVLSVPVAAGIVLLVGRKDAVKDDALRLQAAESGSH
jgi:hypothetical protein